MKRKNKIKSTVNDLDSWLYINKLTGKVELKMFKAPKPKKFLLATSSTSVV